MCGSKHEKWVESIKKYHRGPTIPTFICNEHFAKNDFTLKGNTPILKEDAVPSIFNYTKNNGGPPAKRRRTEGDPCSDCMQSRNELTNIERKLEKLKDTITKLTAHITELNEVQKNTQQTFISTVIISIFLKYIYVYISYMDTHV